MDPQISEFSYGYCLTEEFMTNPLRRLRGAPVFPTQAEEGRIGGFDVGIPRSGLPLFLQFKLCHYLKQANALEWNLHGGPYYRMYIRRRDRSDQQMLMVHWEAAGHEIYYAAPLFHTHRQLSAAYKNGDVIRTSAFFSPSDVGILGDDSEHYITFVPNSRFAYFHSKQEKPIKPPLVGREIYEVIESRFQEQKRDFTQEFFSALIGELKELSQSSDQPQLAQQMEDVELPDREDRVERAAIHASKSCLAPARTHS